MTYDVTQIQRNERKTANNCKCCIKYCSVFRFWDTQFGLLIRFISILTTITYNNESESDVTTNGQSASLSWYKAPIRGLRPDFYFRTEYGIRLTVTFLIQWGALSDEKTGLFFITTLHGPHRKHGLSSVRKACLHSNGSYSIVACVSVAAWMCLMSRCLAMNVHSDFSIPAFFVEWD
jgi:hypothetical protein